MSSSLKVVKNTVGASPALVKNIAWQLSKVAKNTVVIPSTAAKNIAWLFSKAAKNAT